MSRALTLSLGQHSARGRKDRNQDFHGAITPTGPQLELKGVAVALADGISTSAEAALTRPRSTVKPVWKRASPTSIV